MSDRTAEILKAFIRTRGGTAPPTSEPFVEGTSLHGEDVDFLLRELRARHRVELLPNDPSAALEETKKPSGKAAAAAPAGRSQAGATSESKAEEDDSPEDLPVSSSKTRKLRSRLAKLAAQISRMEAQDAEQNRTKRNRIRENQHASSAKGARGAPRK
jgi:hypothetical protein